MTDLVGDLKRRATRGVRAVIVLNLATIPLSFGTNMVLGRVSPDALGYYSAIQLFLATYFTFCVFGGSLVFTRFTPAMESRRRLPFLLTYTSIILGIFAVLVALVPWLTPGLLQRLLHRIGDPSPSRAAAVVFVTILWGFSGYFLYGVLRPSWASMTEKAAVVGFFVASTVGFMAFRDVLSTNPSRYLWAVALAIYGTSAILGIFLVSRTEEFRISGRLRWTLPSGFWPVVFYTHVSTVVNYVHQTLTPSLVLVWLDVAALGRLHAAFRYVLLLNFIPTTVASVMAPAVSKLEASGFRREGFNQSASAIRTTLLLLGPAVLGIILFAGDAMAVFGPGFREHRRILSIIAVSIIAGPVVQCGAGIAAALGAFRSYLVASLIYVVVAVGLTTTLVPVFGLVGAAAAVAAASFVRQTAIFVVLRRLGFPAIPRVWTTWACALAATGLQLWLDPTRQVAAVLWVCLVAAFLWLGRVSVSEARLAVLRLLGKRD